jgi:hypothetical protein
MMSATKIIVAIYILFTVLPIGIIVAMNNSLLAIILKIVLGIVALFTIASGFYTYRRITLGPHLTFLAIFTIVFCLESTPSWLSYTVTFLAVLSIWAKFKQISEIEKQINEQPLQN